MRFSKVSGIVFAVIITLISVTGTGFSASAYKECAALKNLALKDLAFNKPITIKSAGIVPSWFGLPAHCSVEGRIWPETDFAVRMPLNGNGNLYYVGGGGMDGSLALNEWLNGSAIVPGLSAGYATAVTNGGHNSPKGLLGAVSDASFGYNPSDNSNPFYEQKKIDFAYRAAHEGAQAAKKIIKAFYGKLPPYSYFVGCSNGGRNGMMEAQRYPEDFNGYLIGSPQLDYLGAPIRGIWDSQAQLGNGALGYDSTTQASLLSRLAGAVYQKCDALDGLEDGLIDDPRVCDFDPTIDLDNATYACERGASSPCFTAEQRDALKKIYDGPQTSSDDRIFFGTLPGAEIVGIGPMAIFGLKSLWSTFLVPSTYGTCGDAIGESYMKYMAFDPASGPDYDWKTYNFDVDPQREIATRYPALINAISPNLWAVKYLGGKIIHYHGTADTTATTWVSYNYYNKVLATMGSKNTASFYRFYAVPGMDHCATGVGCYTDTANFFSALVAWVEKGIPPQAILGERPINKSLGWKVKRTRPLCPYPQVEKYKGSGSIEDADNFYCQ